MYLIYMLQPPPSPNFDPVSLYDYPFPRYWQVVFFPLATMIKNLIFFKFTFEI